MKISILGCGWLGLPLAKKLLQQDHKVKGSTTSSEKISGMAAEGIDPFLISISPEGVEGDIENFLADIELLFINIPPGLRRNPEIDFTGGIERLVGEIERSGVKKVLFVSSTTVYKDTANFPTYTESDAPNGTSEAAKQLIAVEKMLMENTSFEACILRFGGLIGVDRHPVKYLAGRKDLKNPKAPVNLIHREDCINIITGLLQKEPFEGVFNAVFPGHPSKKEYYNSRAGKAGLPLPEFNEEEHSEGKIIGSVKIGRKEFGEEI